MKNKGYFENSAIGAVSILPFVLGSAQKMAPLGLVHCSYFVQCSGDCTEVTLQRRPKAFSS